jgi:DNA-directed RNA polymerase specialized sigma24 family protein
MGAMLESVLEALSNTQQSKKEFMFRTMKSEIENFRAEYATRADFCEMLENEMASFYLLAFLLTTNHQDAERCFSAMVDEASAEHLVFKECVRSWLKRILIKIAIQVISPAGGRVSDRRDSWGVPQSIEGCNQEIDAITKLFPLERFVFVMSVLEGYSSWECSTLLGCAAKKVLQVRADSLRALAGPSALVPSVEKMISSGLQVSA